MCAQGLCASKECCFIGKTKKRGGWFWTFGWRGIWVSKRWHFATATKS